MKRLIAALSAVLAISASVALAASSSVNVSPSTVKAGNSVRVFGSVGTGCGHGDKAILYTRAFKGSTNQNFGGVPAVYATVGPHHKFSFHIKIRKAIKKGTYTIHGRCGGGNFGHTTLTVIH